MTEMTEHKHSPLPWRHSNFVHGMLVDQNGKMAAHVDHKNIDFILAAVNTHADLVEALKEADKAMRNVQTWGKDADWALVDWAQGKVSAALRKAGQ